MITYTVMADCGVGEFLWSKKESDICGVRANVYSLMDVNCIHEDDDDLIMSMDLLRRFAQWAKWYMAAQSTYMMEPPNIDWNSFNSEGIELTNALKIELGNTANVQYVKAWDDPDGKNDIVDLFLSANG